MTDPTPWPRQNTLKVGLRCRCPRCGQGPLFKGFLSLRDRCPVCDLSYGFADPADGPAFFVMSGAGLLGMIFFLVFEFGVHPPLWAHLVVTLPVLIALCLGGLRPFKAWLVAEEYVRKASEADWKSTGR
jgi:uncharacterized protein (DUF983 family)